MIGKPARPVLGSEQKRADKHQRQNPLHVRILSDGDEHAQAMAAYAHGLDMEHLDTPLKLERGHPGTRWGLHSVAQCASVGSCSVDRFTTRKENRPSSKSTWIRSPSRSSPRSNIRLSSVSSSR